MPGFATRSRSDSIAPDRETGPGCGRSAAVSQDAAGLVLMRFVATMAIW